MPIYRVCKQFTVESGHMLHDHPESCRFPHGHSRRIEVVVQSRGLQPNGMVIDFKALKLAIKPTIEAYDHRMMIHRDDPLAPALREIHPDSILEYDIDPTTEVLAREIFDRIVEILAQGFSGESEAGIRYEIEPCAVALSRVRVWETPTSWAEVQAE